VFLEELTDILVDLEQRINAYKHRLLKLENQRRRRLDDEIAPLKKYLEVAEALHRVEGISATPSMHRFRINCGKFF
jgi:hypothetical protein